MIARIDRVVFRDVFWLALLNVTGLTFLFSALSLYQIVNRFEITPHFGTLMSFAPTLWVSLLPMTLPISVLLSATLVFGRMRADRELLLLSAAGMPPWRPFVSLIVLGLIVGIASFWTASELGPDAYAERHSLQRKALADFIDNPPQGPREMRFPSEPSVDISYQSFDKPARTRQGEFKGFTVMVYNNEGLLATLTADSARVRYSRNSRELVLTQCINPTQVTYDPKSGNPIGTPITGARINELRLNFDFGQSEEVDVPKALKTQALITQIRTDIANEQPKRGAASELVRRVGLGVAGLLLPLLGALLASMIDHPNRLFSVGIGVIPSSVGYYPLMTFASTQAESGTFDPISAALIAPVGALLAILLLVTRQIRGKWF